MFVFYIIALLPVLIGLGLYIFSTKFVLFEWFIVIIVSFVLAYTFQCLSFYGLTTDYETWSGQIVQATHYSAWEEYYEEAIYRTETYRSGTDKNGNATYSSREVFDHWEPETEWHGEHWHWWSNIQTDYEIDPSTFNYISRKFNDLHSVVGERSTYKHKSHMIAGDPNDYVSNNHTGWIQPVTKQVMFENRIKAAGPNSVFSFQELSIEQKKHLFSYPLNSNYILSDRVIGEAKKTIDTFLWDQMNARLGAAKKVNVIIIGFDSSDENLGEQQEALYLRGRKNDLILVYGNGWTHTFGWTESEIVKQKLDDILANNKIDNNIIPLIEEEIRLDYVKKSWKKFNYIAIEPPSIYYLYYFLTLIVVEGGVITWSLMNQFNKNGEQLKMTKEMDAIFTTNSSNSLYNSPKRKRK